MTMHKQIQIVILPLVALGAIVDLTAQVLHQEAISCAILSNAPAADHKACGRGGILEDLDRRAVR